MNSLKKLCLILILIFVSSYCYSYRPDKEYYAGELRTIESYKYGRFEVVMKSAMGDGFISSFFTYNDNVLPDHIWNEIDIEVLGKHDKVVSLNMITSNQWSRRINHPYDHTTQFNPGQAFHHYAFEWTPHYIAWFIDGKEIHRETYKHILDLMNQPQKIMMNLWT